MSAQQPQAPATPQVPRPSFETKAEIVLVDVNVVDRDARPVPTLTPADFELEVNGQPRKIDSVQFISTTPTNTSAATPRESAYTSNESATTGRLLLFVVDEGSLRVGANRTILRTAQSLFHRLAPGDLVGLARLPNGFGGVEFTADRKRVTDGLMRVTGAASTPHRHDAHQHQRSVGAREQRRGHVPERRRSRMRRHDRRRSRGLRKPARSRRARACCSRPAARARATLQSLEALLKNLAPLKTPVNIVLMSEGMFVARDRQT